MILHLLGVHHNDPISRLVCDQRLRTLSERHTGQPAFIATEWDSRHFLEVKSQRPQLRQLFHTKWPNASGELLDHIERTPGFEADVHECIFPAARIIWLDEGRPDSSGSIPHFAQYCLALYRDILGDAQLPLDADTTLRLLSRELWRRTEGQTPNYDRDNGWFIKLQSVVEEGNGTWGITIVGHGHLRTEFPHSFYSLLQIGGFECHATSCRLQDF